MHKYNFGFNSSSFSVFYTFICFLHISTTSILLDLKIVFFFYLNNFKNIMNIQAFMGMLNTHIS